MAIAVKPVATADGPVTVAVKPAAVAIGPVAIAIGPVAIAIGPVAIAIGPVAIAIGPVTVAIDPVAIAIGATVAAAVRTPGGGEQPERILPSGRGGRRGTGQGGLADVLRNAHAQAGRFGLQQPPQVGPETDRGDAHDVSFRFGSVHGRKLSWICV